MCSGALEQIVAERLQSLLPLGVSRSNVSVRNTVQSGSAASRFVASEAVRPSNGMAGNPGFPGCRSDSIYRDSHREFSAEVPSPDFSRPPSLEARRQGASGQIDPAAGGLILVGAVVPPMPLVGLTPLSLLIAVQSAGSVGPRVQREMLRRRSVRSELPSAAPAAPA